MANTEERIQIRGAHRQMAEHLARSRREIPEATVWVDVDAAGLLRAKRLLDEANADRPTGTGIATWLARFCVLGLQRFPLLNSRIDGVDGSAAIINFPEVAIVGVGRIVDRPWACDGEVRVRPVTELTLSFDHRVCDGGVAGGFLRFVADCVEEPVRLLNL